jgi:ferrochelatase
MIPSGSSRKKWGVLLINLGTPDDPSPEAVGRYLKEFLMDPLVVDVPAALRWLLVNVAIVPRRKYSSSEAYKQIWQLGDSPLRLSLLELTQGLRERLATQIQSRQIVIDAGMRYGSPSILNALTRLREKDCTDLFVIPLYPQYSLAATESSLQNVEHTLSQMNWGPRVCTLRDFHDDPRFIEAFAEVARPALAEYKPDGVIFSFHGLPERQVHKTDRSALPGKQRGTHCLTPDCCEKWIPANRDCYRAQCFRTAALLAQALGIPKDRHFVSFQSRLGRTPWIQPFTDEVYKQLPRQGIKRVAVMCPSFVADCLETLEEISIRGNESFIAAGGADLRLIPSLNASQGWQGALEAWIVERIR